MKIFISVVSCVAIGFLAGMATAEAIPTWYVTLNKPFFNPPNWLFGPVWTVLYLAMGLAAGLIWNQSTTNPLAKGALTIFVIQLVLNGSWSFFFFAWKQLLLSFFVIILLWLLIVLCIRRFRPINKLAAYFLYPYLLWVTFASVLNFSIWYLN